MKLLNEFNSDRNARGAFTKVILLSTAGTTGISLKAIKHVHIFENSINEFNIKQAEGRAFRVDSHNQLKLPGEDKPNPAENVVTVHRYFVTKCKSTPYEGLTSDELLYERALKKMSAVQNLLQVMRLSAFDCNEDYNKALHGQCYYESDDIEELRDAIEMGFNLEPAGVS